MSLRLCAFAGIFTGTTLYPAPSRGNNTYANPQKAQKLVYSVRWGFVEATDL
jgi:hypothetical protein